MGIMLHCFVRRSEQWITWGMAAWSHLCDTRAKHADMSDTKIIDCYYIHIATPTLDLIVWTTAHLHFFPHMHSWLMNVFRLLVYHKFNDSIHSYKAALHHVYYRCHSSAFFLYLSLPSFLSLMPMNPHCNVRKVIVVNKASMMSSKPLMSSQTTRTRI